MTATPTLGIDIDRLPSEAGVLVGYSGGLDSTVLLHLLAERLPPSRLRALHVHHGLHPQADAWSQHCAATCAQLGLDCDIVRVRVDHGAGHGMEAAARHARHAAFAAALRTGEVLALAHHQQDQAETFLLRALRASGVDGLGAMHAWRPYAAGSLWRPLLSRPRPQLLAWARQQSLQWLEDSSNLDTALDRNFIRHRVMPVLRERWPHAEAMFARSATLAAEAAELLAHDDDSALAAARDADPSTLRVSALLTLSSARRARLLRHWIADLGLPPLPAQGVERIEADLMVAAPDADAAFAWSHACVRRWRDLLHAAPQRPALPRDWQVEWRGETPLALPDGSTLCLLGAAAFDEPVRVHARRGGERISLPGRAHTHTLKHLLQEAGLPPWLREHLPLLSNAAGTLLAAGDRVLSAEMARWLADRQARLYWDAMDG